MCIDMSNVMQLNIAKQKELFPYTYSHNDIKEKY